MNCPTCHAEGVPETCAECPSCGASLAQEAMPANLHDPLEINRVNLSLAQSRALALERKNRKLSRQRNQLVGLFVLVLPFLTWCFFGGKKTKVSVSAPENPTEQALQQLLREKELRLEACENSHADTFHVVVLGDTPGSIAKKYYGDFQLANFFMRQNEIRNDRTLTPGETLRLSRALLYRPDLGGR